MRVLIPNLAHPRAQVVPEVDERDGSWGGDHLGLVLQ
jgi:hypothetical protein